VDAEDEDIAHVRTVNISAVARKTTLCGRFSSYYEFATNRLGVPARSIAFQSSNAWDAYAASAFGMQVVWCNRYGQRAERLPGAPDREVKSLAELPALAGAS